MSSPTQTEALAAFAKACAHDKEGREAEAIPHYREALELGLPVDERRRALVGLGASLRNVAEHAEAVRVLAGAVAEFPDYHALRAFYALALLSAGEGREAVAQLLDVVVLANVPVDRYERAITWYRDDLRGVAIGP
jgi:tetratricopeptide (TPR) repeat protein